MSASVEVCYTESAQKDVIITMKMDDFEMWFRKQYIHQLIIDCIKVNPDQGCCDVSKLPKIPFPDHSRKAVMKSPQKVVKRRRKKKLYYTKPAKGAKKM